MGFLIEINQANKNQMALKAHPNWHQQHGSFSNEEDGSLIDNIAFEGVNSYGVVWPPGKEGCMEIK